MQCQDAHVNFDALSVIERGALLKFPRTRRSVLRRRFKLCSLSVLNAQIKRSLTVLKQASHQFAYTAACKREKFGIDGLNSTYFKVENNSLELTRIFKESFRDQR